MTSRRDDIITVARELLDAQGSEGLTMRAIAAELGSDWQITHDLTAWRMATKA